MISYIPAPKNLTDVTKHISACDVSITPGHKTNSQSTIVCTQYIHMTHGQIRTTWYCTCTIHLLMFGLYPLERCPPGNIIYTRGITRRIQRTRRYSSPNHELCTHTVSTQSITCTQTHMHTTYLAADQQVWEELDHWQRGR